ncbi:MAG: AbrB/MazE/SpoVT family DNA-binding domain-containing protein [Candidatus Omnitrophica bacterium]|nr:AbrB/MazE/SpoVT family DNA-binding domain-containing protein [Candidatus Omnitrophota bacterium]
MKATIVPIGNSKGIRIPRAVLEQCHFTNEVDLEIKGETLILKSIHKKPRQGWDEAFKMMHLICEDNPLVDDTLDLNIKEWQW